MKYLRFNALVTAGVVACFASTWVHAEDVSSIKDNEGIFVDGRTFKVISGQATGDSATQVGKLGARELGPGALIFRSGDKLFIVDAPLRLRATGAAGGQVDVRADTAKPMRPNRIRVESVPPKKAELQNVYRHVKEERVLEILQHIFSPFRLPEDLTIRTRECGMVNAWYRYEDTGPAINVCYEYLNFIANSVPKETTPDGITQTDARIGELVYLVAHEFGHAVFHLYDVPILGNQEDAADQFAAYILLWVEKQRARKLIGGAAYTYKKVMEAAKEDPKVTLPLDAYSSDHGRPAQRFYNLLCMAYGADAKEFAYLVKEGYLPERRAPHCDYEFSTLNDAIRKVITPHIDQAVARKVFQKRWIDVLAMELDRSTSRRSR